MDLVSLLEKSFIEISELIQYQNSLELSNLQNENNCSGDDVKKIDQLSNYILKENLSSCELIRMIGSEEEDELCETSFKNAPYLVCYDPLDGSSNIGVNITTGTIFGVYEYDENNKIKSGRNLVMSGYCLYGGCTQFLLNKDNKLSFYQLNKEKKFDLLVNDLKIKEKGNTYSLNESNKKLWSNKHYEIMIEKCIENNYTSRWVGSLVADGHRTLINGGFFAYPENSKNKKGKIRLLYEAYPFAHIFEVGGGIGSNGYQDLLDIPFPEHIHEKTPIVLCGKYENDVFQTLKK